MIDRDYIIKVTNAVNFLTGKDSLFSRQVKRIILAEFERAVVPVGMKVMNGEKIDPDRPEASVGYVEGGKQI